MQEEVNQKVISLSIQGVKITASVLKAALRKFLEMDNRRKQKATQVKMAEKTGRAQEKGREKARKKIEKKKPHGKQTIKQLNAQGVQLSNLKITDENIKELFQEDEIVCEAFDVPEYKAMLVSGILEHFPEKKLIAASGLAGYESSNLIRTRRVSKNFYLCGDEVTVSTYGKGLMAPRAALCATHEANMITRLLLGEEDV